jgi:hypothetical protein
MKAPFDYISISEISKIKVWYYTKSSGQPFFVNIAFAEKMTHQQFIEIKKIIELEDVQNITLTENQIITFTK